MTKIKVCGIRTIEDVSIINDIKPEYAGFVLAPSKRSVSIVELQKLIAALDSSIIPVGVFVNETESKLLEAFEAGIKIFQLHGDEDQDYINMLCQKLQESKFKNKISIWKAIRIDCEQSIASNINENICGIDALLLDKYSKDSYGGTGEKFNWNIFRGFNSIMPLILAGGLTHSNVLEGIEIVKPYCVDVSSGVEIDGKKNREMIERFVNKIRNNCFRGE